MNGACGTAATCFGRWIMSVFVQDSWKCEKFSTVGFYPICEGGLMQLFWGRLVGGGGLLRWSSYAKLGSRQDTALEALVSASHLSD